MGFLHFGYAYALIGLEINIRLDLISSVCIIIPANTQELAESALNNFAVVPSNSEGGGDASQAAASAAALDDMIKKATGRSSNEFSILL